MPSDEIPPDAELAAEAASGNESAFGMLFDRYYDRVRAFAYRIMLEHGAAEDVTQESFIKAARAIRDLDTGRTFQAWIYRICTNTARDALRAQRSHEAKLEQAARHHEILRDGNNNASAEAAFELLQALSPDQREAVALVFFEDCTHAEAASRLGCAESTVSWRIHLAKRRLRRLVNR